MTPETVLATPRSDAANGQQDVAMFGAVHRPEIANHEATPDPSALSPVDRRTSLTGLSVAVRDVRIRLARKDIYDALDPISRHSEAVLICLEVGDEEGLEHHLRRVVEGARKAAGKHRELRVLLSERGLGARR